jgi:D-3-phosphoglycerate dehydrogenase
MLSRAYELQFIGRAGSGMENIDVAYATSKGIACVNSPEGNRDAVGEHAMGMLLALLHHLKQADLEVREGIWRREANRGTELKGKTVGIIGYGNTGSAFARKLSGFEAHILAYDKYKANFGNDYVKEVALEAIFRKSDVVSLHIPLTEETRYWADRTFFASFEKPVTFINTSRGKVVRTKDLVAALQEGQLKGACLDVFEEENLTFEEMAKFAWMRELSNMTNVILSPHIAGWTHESKQRIADILLEKVKLVIGGS